MRKFTFIAAVFVCFLCAVFTLIHAKAEHINTDAMRAYTGATTGYEGKYARVITDDCALYADQSLKVIKYIIPETYCVKLTSVGTETSRVTYMDGNSLVPCSEGYVKNINLHFLDETPETIYPDITLTTTGNAVLFTDTALTNPKTVIETGVTGTYYGEITILGASYVYVYINGYAGYVRKDGFASFTVPEVVFEVEPDPDTDQSDDSTGETVQNTANTFSESEIIVAGALIITGLIVMFFILKPQDKNGGRKPFDDGDYN